MSGIYYTSSWKGLAGFLIRQLKSVSELPLFAFHQQTQH